MTLKQLQTIWYTIRGKKYVHSYSFYGFILVPVLFSNTPIHIYDLPHLIQNNKITQDVGSAGITSCNVDDTLSVCLTVNL